MRTGLAAIDHRARGLGVGIAWISLSLGSALTLASRKTAGLLGWGSRMHLARVVGVADLVVGTGLLLSRHPSRWMLARTLLSAVIGGAYAGVLLAGTLGRGRAIGGVCMMSALPAKVTTCRGSCGRSKPRIIPPQRKITDPRMSS